MSTKKPTYEELKGKLEKTEALLAKLQKAKNNAFNSVSENKEYLEAYKASEQNFKNLIDASPLGVRIITAEGSLIYANQAILDICGYKTPQELAAVPRDKIYTPESYAAHQERKKKRTLKEFVPSEYEVSIKRPDGEVRHLQVFRREVIWGGERQFMALYQDITERKRAEEALRESEERFRGIFQQGPIGILFSGLDFQIIFVNDQLCQMLGYTERELRSMDLKSTNYPGETDDDASLGKLAKGEVKYFHREKRGYRKNREIIWQNLTVTIVRDKNDQPLGYLTMIEDITERKRAEEAEKESEERFHSIVEHGNDGIVFIQQGLVQYCNTKMLEMLDYTEAEAIGKPFLDFVAPEFKKRMADIYKKRVSGGKAQERYEAILVAKKGGKINVEISASLMNLKGEVIDIAIVRDMTSRKNVEQTLENEVIRRRILIEQSRDGIVVLDHNGNVFEANQKFADMLGYTPEEVRNLKVYDWEFLYTKEQIVEMIRTVDEKGDHFETQHRRKDGSTYDVEISTNGAIFGQQKLVFCVCRDITERKQMEKALRESEEKFSKAFLASPAVIAITRLEDGKYIEVNDTYLHSTGYTREEIIGKTTVSMNVWAEPQERLKMLRILKEKGRITREEFHFRIKSDEVRTWLFSAEPITFGGEECLIGVSIDITERKKTQAELEREREDIKLIMDTSKSFIWYKDVSGKYLRVNRAYAEALDINEKDFLGKTVFDLYSKAIAQNMVLSDREVIISGSPKLNIIEQYESATGLRWVQTDKVPVLDKDGKTIALIGFAQDITERQEAEEAFRALSARQEAILGAVPDIIMEVDKNKVYTWANDAGIKFFGKDVIGKEASYYFEGEQETYDTVKPLFKGDENIIYVESWQRRKDGKKRLLAWWCRTMKDSDGNVTGALSTARDITERNQAEEAIKESEERFRTLFETMAQGVIYRDAEGKIISANPAAEKIMGKKLKDMLGKTSSELGQKRINEDGSEVPFEEQPSSVALRTGKPVNNVIIAVYNSVEKQYRWILNNAIPQFRQGEKKPYRVYTTFTDITGRKQAEQRINNLNETLRSIRNINQLITREKDREKLIQGVCNTLVESRSFFMAWIVLFDESRRMITYAQSGMPGDFTPIAERIGKGHYPACVERALNNKGVAVFENPENCTDCDMFDKNLDYGSMAIRLEYSGSIFGILCSSLPKEIIVDQNEVSLFQEVADDVSFALYNMELQFEHDRLEQERLRAAKLESIGTLAGGIAHDFNNLLTGIMGNIGLVKSITDSTKPDYEMLEEAEKAAMRASDLTQQLLTFARGGKPIKKSVQIADIIKESATFALRGSKAKLELKIPDDLWLIEADESQISQVINNLVINADEAMPTGGTVKITAENVTQKSSANQILPDGNYVHIDIADTGIGMSKEHIERIFEPYFTTKQRGSGLGLTSAYSIVKNHGGIIFADSIPNKGSTFNVYLLATKKPVTKGGKIMSTKTAGQAGGKILVMDDEEIIRKMLKNMLSLAGYTIELSADGDEALKKYQQAKKEGGPFDAVIMDLTIPGGMGGKDAVQKLLEIDPNAVAIVSSGYATDPIMSDYKAYGFKAVIAKPYSVRQLQETLSGLLSKRKK